MNLLQGDPYNGLAKLITEKDADVKFDDLQSVIRSFKQYLNYDIPIDEEEKKTIIFYTQCRHILAHSSGKVDDTFLSRVNAHGANLHEYKVGDVIELNEGDWERVVSHFDAIIHKMHSHIEKSD